MTVRRDLALLFAGVALGLTARAAWPDRPAEADAVERKAGVLPVDPTTPGRSVGPCPAATQRALDLQARWTVEVDTTCADRVRAAGGAVPTAFPQDLPDTFRPDAITAAIATALSECPGADALDVTVDCSEFPCVTLAHGEAMLECAGLPSTHHFLGRALGPDSAQLLTLVSHVPQDFLDDDDVLARDIRRRLDARFDAAAAWYADDDAPP